MTRNPHSTGGTSGFTLIELLVAMSVVALLGVLLFGGLRFAAHSAGSVNRRSDDAAQVALAYDFMQRGLAAAQPFPVTEGQPRSAVQFYGTPESVAFVALAPPHVGLGGLLAFRMSLEGGSFPSRLAVTWSELYRGFPERGAAMQRPLLLVKGVRSVRLAYFGATLGNQRPGWTDHWTGRSDLPRLVRMRLTLEDGYRPPDLIVAPRLRPAER